MPVKRLLLLCSLIVALLALGIFTRAQQKAGPAQATQRIKQAIKNMAHAIEVYSSSGSLKGTSRHVHAMEEDVAALTHILPADSPMLHALQAARNSLTHAALISDAYRRRRRVPDEEIEALSVICDEYGVPLKQGRRLRTDVCIKRIMRQARKRHREAFSVASREGVYMR